MTYHPFIKQELTSNIANEQPQFLQTFSRCEAYALGSRTTFAIVISTTLRQVRSKTPGRGLQLQRRSIYVTGRTAT